MDLLVGVSDVRELRVLVAGLPCLTATLAYTLTAPNGTTVLLTGVPAPHIGDGWYQVALDGTDHLSATGLYREVWAGSTGAAADDLLERGAFLVGDAQGPLLTRWELRHAVAAACDDLLLGTVAGATASTLADPERIETNGHWRGADCAIWAGAGRDQARRVSASAVGELTVGRSWAAPAVGDRYELHRLRPAATYDAAINQAIAEGGRTWFLPVTDDTLVVADSSGEVPLPAGLTTVCEVYVASGTGAPSWCRRRWQYDEWRILRGKRALALPGARAGDRVRLEGTMTAGLLLRDAAYCDLPPSYVIHQAAAALLAPGMGGTVTDPGQQAIRVKYHADEAERYRPKQSPPGRRVR